MTTEEKLDLILEILADIWEVLQELAPHFKLRLIPPPALARWKKEREE